MLPLRLDETLQALDGLVEVRLRFQARDGLVSRGGEHNRIACVLQALLQGQGDQILVLDHQNGGVPVFHALLSGS